MNKTVHSDLTHGVKRVLYFKVSNRITSQSDAKSFKTVTWEDLQINTPLFCSCYSSYVNLPLWHDIHCGKLVECIYDENMFIRC
jgi:hypothetical protein